MPATGKDVAKHLRIIVMFYRILSAAIAALILFGLTKPDFHREPLYMIAVSLGFMVALSFPVWLIGGIVFGIILYFRTGFREWRIVGPLWILACIVVLYGVSFLLAMQKVPWAEHVMFVIVPCFAVAVIWAGMVGYIPSLQRTHPPGVDSEHEGRIH